MTACSDCNYGKRAQVVENVPESSTAQGGLVGFYGFSLEPNTEKVTPEHQFHVIRQVEGGYMVQLFDWLLGDESELQFYPTATLLDSSQVRLFANKQDWTFYLKRIMERDWNARHESVN